MVVTIAHRTERARQMGHATLATSVQSALLSRIRLSYQTVEENARWGTTALYKPQHHSLVLPEHSTTKPKERDRKIVCRVPVGHIVAGTVINNRMVSAHQVIIVQMVLTLRNLWNIPT